MSGITAGDVLRIGLLKAILSVREVMIMKYMTIGFAENYQREY